MARGLQRTLELGRQARRGVQAACQLAGEGLGGRFERQVVRIGALEGVPSMRSLRPLLVRG